MLYSRPVKITWDNVWKLVSMVQVWGIARVTWELIIPYWDIIHTYAKTTSISQCCSGNLGVWWPSAHQGSYSLTSEIMHVCTPFHSVEGVGWWEGCWGTSSGAPFMAEGSLEPCMAGLAPAEASPSPHPEPGTRVLGGNGLVHSLRDGVLGQ